MSKKRYMELLLEQIRNKRAKELVAHEITSFLFYIFTQCTSHRTSLRDLGHLRIIQPRIALDAGIAQISVHTVDLCQVFAAADRTHIHI